MLLNFLVLVIKWALELIHSLKAEIHKNFLKTLRN